MVNQLPTLTSNFQKKEVGQTFLSVPGISVDLVPAGGGLTGNGAVQASPAKSFMVKQAALLFVGNHDVVNVVSLRVLALEGRSARFSVFRDLRSHGHRHLAALLHRGLDRVGINSLYRNRVSVWDAGNRVVLAVEFCVVLNVRRTSVGVDDLGVDLHAFLVSLDLNGGAF